MPLHLLIMLLSLVVALGGSAAVADPVPFSVAAVIEMTTSATALAPTQATTAATTTTFAETNWRRSQPKQAATRRALSHR